MRKTLAILLLAGTTFLAGCGDSEEFVFNPQNPIQLAPPICVDDAYTTNADTPLSVNAANGVLANDTPNGADITFDATSAQGGTITGLADGSFTYTPPANFTGSDTFDYTLGNSGGVVTCTVTITVQAVNGYFVDATNGNDGTGSFNGGLPFATVQAAVSAAPINADIVVRPGNYTGTVNLKDGQRLLGSGSALVNPQGVNRPELTGPVVMADGNTLDFLRVEGTNGSSVDVSDQDGGTVTNCEFANTTNTGGGVAGLSVTGSWAINNNTFENLDGTAVFLTSTVGDNLIAVVRDNSMSNGDLGAVGLASEDSSTITASVTGNTSSNNNNVTGDAFEFSCGDTSIFCLDLETNVNDADYVLFETNGAGTMSVEQLNTLTDPQPGGAGNTGTVVISTGPISEPPTEVSDGTCVI